MMNDEWAGAVGSGQGMMMTQLINTVSVVQWSLGVGSRS